MLFYMKNHIKFNNNDHIIRIMTSLRSVCVCECMCVCERESLFCAQGQHVQSNAKLQLNMPD